MDPREIDTLIQRLVQNPHDGEALAYAHQAGAADPRSYAILLEKVGQATADPSYAAHWLSEAANVWSTTIGDAHHAARTLMIAIEKDPTQGTAAERLAQLYRDKGDQKALVALLEKLVKMLSPLVYEKPEVRQQLGALHEELGRLWSEPPLARPERALENWRRLVELDPQNAYAVYAARELLKQQQQWADAIPYFGLEQALVDDPQRKLALYRDEAEVRRRTRDLPGATQALRNALAAQPDDTALKQEVGTAILERIDAGEKVPQQELDEAAALFVSLAEMYDGEYGLSYSTSALRAAPGHDRAMQLADYYATQLNRVGELGSRYAAYLVANPNGFMAGEAQAKAGGAQPAPPPGSGPVIAPARQSDAGAPAPAQPAPAQPGPGGEQQAAFNAGSASPAAPQQASVPVERASSSGMAAPVDMGSLQALLEEAQGESQKGRKPQALAKYREALKIDPANSEALSWVEEHLRQKRMYADLRDVLLAASRVPSVSPETRKQQLRDVAGLCESQLRDLETAISAWKQVCSIDRGDEQARDQLRRLLERGARWDDLATMLEQEAMGTPDVEQKIALEKKLATLHEQKRKDPLAAAEAWSRIAGLSPEDESATNTAVKLYEKAERFDMAAQFLGETVANLPEKAQKAPLLQKLGDLRLKTNDLANAGEAFAEAAETLGQVKLWEQAEKAFLGANVFDRAAFAIEQRAQLVDAKQQHGLYAQAADYFLKGNDAASAIKKFERASELDPTNDTYAQSLDELYRRESREQDLVGYLLARADKVGDRGRRVAARRSAADIQRQLGDVEGARESLLSLLSDGDDAEALTALVEDAQRRGDHQESVELLRRLGAITKNPADKLSIALREASILAENLDDLEGAIERYESIYKTLDPKSRIALHAIADLQEKRGNHQGAADALEREIPLAEGMERVDLAQRLAQIYEGPLPNPRGAIKALEIVHAADAEDFDAIARLQKLCEDIEDWPRVAEFMHALIEVEGDEEEASRMTRRLADVLDEKLKRGDEALAALEKLADQGDAECRDAYVDLGDRLGWKGIVATKLVAWNESAAGPVRAEALRSAFSRFLEIGRDADAARVALELARSKSADHGLAEQLEQIATKLKDLDALGVAHDLLAKELSGAARASELVRQAEVQVAAGIDPLEAMQHGEAALTSVPPNEVESLLARLASLTQAPGHVIDLYERQVGRCRAPADRLAALARAAQVAAERGANDRARSFFELALSGGVQEDTISALESAARMGDERSGGRALRTILAEALAAGGQGSRDGGRTRGALLRRAATLAHRDLGDIDKAFGWIGDALITHVDDPSLEALEALGREVGDMNRVEATLGRALEEVFDGPLVRKLLHRRAKLRREVLGDKKGASVDLKKLHDLSPADQDVMNDLSNLLLELGDHRGMIQLYEDQILRGRDPALRAELARKVARLWEEEIGDARESADAWRRVLRMKAADPDATAGLERAKAGKLKRPPPAPAMPAGLAPPPSAPAAQQPHIVPPPPPSSPTAPSKAPVHTEDDIERTADEAPPPDAPAGAIADPASNTDTTPSYLQPGSVPPETTPTPTHDAPPPAYDPQAYADPNAYAQHQGYDPAQHPGYDPAQAQAYSYGQAQPQQAWPGQPDPNQPAYDYSQQGYPQQPAYDPNAYAQQGYAQPYPGAEHQQGYPQAGEQQGYPPAQHDPQQQGQYAYPYPYDPSQQQHAQHPEHPGGYPPPPGGYPPPAPGEEVADVDDAELLDEDDPHKPQP